MGARTLNVDSRARLRADPDGPGITEAREQRPLAWPLGLIPIEERRLDARGAGLQPGAHQRALENLAPVMVHGKANRGTVHRVVRSERHEALACGERAARPVHRSGDGGENQLMRVGMRMTALVESLAP